MTDAFTKVVLQYIWALMKNDVVIRLAEAQDAKLLETLGRFTFYETWIAVKTEEDMQLYLADAFLEEKLRKELNDASCFTYFLAEMNDEVVGYAKLRRDRSYPELAGKKAIELERIYVKNKFQGTKVGKALMDRCMELSRNEKFDVFWLGVNVDNTRAINFYQKYGFEIFGEKMFKLGKAEDKDYLMKLSLI